MTEMSSAPQRDDLHDASSASAPANCSAAMCAMINPETRKPCGKPAMWKSKWSRSFERWCDEHAMILHYQGVVVVKFNPNGKRTDEVRALIAAKMRSCLEAAAREIIHLNFDAAWSCIDEAQIYRAALTSESRPPNGQAQRRGEEPKA